MYKNQLQELAQRSCFNLPSYSCVREGPDHAPRFKSVVAFNGEAFESPSFCPTLRQAEHAAARVALAALSTRGPSLSLCARMLDETGVCKNLLQETAHRGGLSLPVYTTLRSGPGHLPVFTCVVEVGGQKFVGQEAKTKKQAEKNAAVAALSTLKSGSNLERSSVETSALQAFGCRRRGKVGHGRDRSARREAKQSSSPQLASLSNNGAASSLLQYIRPQSHPSVASHEFSMPSAPGHTERMTPVRVTTLTPAAREDSRARFEEHCRNEKQWLPEEVLKSALQDDGEDPSALHAWGGSAQNWALHPVQTRGGGFKPQLEDPLRDEEDWLRGVAASNPAAREDSRARFEEHCRDAKQWLPEEVLKPALQDDGEDPLALHVWGGSAQNWVLHPVQTRGGGFKPQLEDPLRDEEDWLRGGAAAPKASMRSGEGSSYDPRMWTSSSRSWDCQPAAAYTNALVRALPSSSRVEFRSQLDEHSRDEEEWLSKSTMKAVFEEATYTTPRTWDNSSQSRTCHSQSVAAAAYACNPFQFQSVASMAPPVRVRQVATVCSAPPRRVDIASKAREDERTHSELTLLRSLSQLRL